MLRMCIKVFEMRIQIRMAKTTKMLNVAHGPFMLPKAAKSF